MSTDITTRTTMAHTLRVAADLLERIGGDVHIGNVYSFSPSTINVLAEDVDSLLLWAKAANVEVATRRHKDTDHHTVEGSIGGKTVHAVFIQQLYAPVDVTDYTAEELDDLVAAQDEAARR